MRLNGHSSVEDTPRETESGVVDGIKDNCRSGPDSGPVVSYSSMIKKMALNGHHDGNASKNLSNGKNNEELTVKKGLQNGNGLKYDEYQKKDIKTLNQKQNSTNGSDKLENGAEKAMADKEEEEDLDSGWTEVSSLKRNRGNHTGQQTKNRKFPQDTRSLNAARNKRNTRNGPLPESRKAKPNENVNSEMKAKSVVNSDVNPISKNASNPVKTLTQNVNKSPTVNIWCAKSEARVNDVSQGKKPCPPATVEEKNDSSTVGNGHAVSKNTSPSVSLKERSQENISSVSGNKNDSILVNSAKHVANGHTTRLPEIESSEIKTELPVVTEPKKRNRKRNRNKRKKGKEQNGDQKEEENGSCNEEEDDRISILVVGSYPSQPVKESSDVPAKEYVSENAIDTIPPPETTNISEDVLPETAGQDALETKEDNSALASDPCHAPKLSTSENNQNSPSKPQIDANSSDHEISSGCPSDPAISAKSASDSEIQVQDPSEEKEETKSSPEDSNKIDLENVEEKKVEEEKVEENVEKKVEAPATIDEEVRKRLASFKLNAEAEVFVPAAASYVSRMSRNTLM